MFMQLTSVVVDPSEENRSELTSFLASHGVAVIGAVSTIEQLANVLARGDRPQMAIVNLDPGAADNLRSLTPVIKKHPETAIFTLSQVLDPNLLMDAMGAGVREFVPLPINEARFKAAIERLASQYGVRAKAKIINIVPTIGGVGSTTIACNIAASLAEKCRTALLDLDVVRGSVASSFDLRPRYTIADVMASADTLDKQLLDNALVTHERSKLQILARPDLPEDTQRITQHGISRLLGILGRTYDYVVLDSVMSVDPVYAAAISAANVHLVVMQLNVPSAKNAERYVGMLRRMGIETSRIKIVVNRYVKKGWDIDPSEVERSLGLKLNWMIPNDYKNAIAAINFGEPVVLRAPRSEMSVAIKELVEFLSEQPALAQAA